MAIFNSPKQRNVTFTDQERTLVFRHPWHDGSIRIGIGRLDPGRKSLIVADAWKLLEAAPRRRSEAPDVDSKLLELYFKRLEELDAGEADIELGVVPVGYKADDMVFINEESMELYFRKKTAWEKIRKDRDGLKRDNEALRSQVDALVRQTGARSQVEKKTSIRKAFEHFKKHIEIRAGSKQPEDEKLEVLRRVEAVLGELGWEKRFAEVRLADVQRALDESVKAKTKEDKPKSDNEKTKRAFDVKRFFRFLTRPVERNGLGFSVNPSDGLQYISLKRIQHKRKAMGLVKYATEPEKVLEKLPEYWAAFYAVWCYAGARRMESAALVWDWIDFDRKIISVKYSAIYPELKNYLSPRAIKPFKQIWPWLERYREKKKNDVIVFPKPKRPTEYWITKTKRGSPTIDHLTREMTRELVKAGAVVSEEPNLAARRYWATQVNIHCPHLKEAMGAHSKIVHDSHYADSLKVVEQVKGDWC